MRSAAAFRETSINSANANDLVFMITPIPSPQSSDTTTSHSTSWQTPPASRWLSRKRARRQTNRYATFTLKWQHREENAVEHADHRRRVDVVRSLVFDMHVRHLGGLHGIGDRKST